MNFSQAFPNQVKTRSLSPKASLSPPTPLRTVGESPPCILQPGEPPFCSWPVWGAAAQLRDCRPHEARAPVKDGPCARSGLSSPRHVLLVGRVGQQAGPSTPFGGSQPGWQGWSALKSGCLGRNVVVTGDWSSSARPQALFFSPSFGTSLWKALPPLHLSQA